MISWLIYSMSSLVILGGQIILAVSSNDPELRSEAFPPVFNSKRSELAGKRKFITLEF